MFDLVIYLECINIDFHYAIIRELGFEDAEVLIDISLYGCRAAKEQSPSVLPPPPPPIPPPPSAPTNNSVGLSGRNGSFISLQVSENQVLKR